MYNPERAVMRLYPAMRRKSQRGMTLLELLVGIALGLLVISAAIGTLLLTRQTSGTVSDVSQLQQQASFALRVIGQQLRQAGTLELNPIPGGAGTFTTASFTAVDGTDGLGNDSDMLTVQNEWPTPASYTQQSDCTGKGPVAGERNTSVFAVNAGQLRCKNSTASTAIPQPVISNVADFQVVYRVNTGTTSSQVLRLLTATQMTPGHWNRVRAIEICLDLVGNEPIPDAGGTYVNCKGSTVPRAGRIHFVSRNVFDVRKENPLEIALP